MVDEEAALQLQAMPTVPINFVPAKAGDTFSIGMITVRVMEDGSRTDNRISAGEFTVPAGTKGPPPHWHEMHDETFLVTKGKLRFHSPDGKFVDATTGDYIVVPTRAPHTFSNPFEEEARFFNTFTPAHYINFFKLLSTMATEGKPLDPAINIQGMARYATIPAKEFGKLP